MCNLIPTTDCTTNSGEAFDSRINNWADGVLLTIDAENSKITIRGAKRPYASEYPKMLKSICERSENMSQVDRSRQASEIRLNWKSALEKAHAEETEKIPT